MPGGFKVMSQPPDVVTQKYLTAALYCHIYTQGPSVLRLGISSDCQHAAAPEWRLDASTACW